MGCQEENTFLRYGDTPSLDNAGFVKVASSHDQLENMSLEDKERIVASVALLDSFSESLSNKLNNLVQNITPKIDDQELEDKVTDLINTLNANNNTESLDIKQVFALQRLNSLELKWITPNYSKPYKVRVFKNTRPSYVGATLLGVVNHTQDYRTILESEIGTDEKVYFFVRAYDEETQGANSPITSFDGKDWLDSLIKMLRGKITETLLSRELIDSIYTGFGNKLNNEIEKTLQQARNSVIESERTINNVITQLRGSIDQELVSVKGQLQDQGTDIRTLERKSEGLAEQITRISAVADNAIAGIQEEKIARATENEAFARETNTRIAQTNNAIATVRDDLKVQTDNYQSLTQKVEDYKNIYDQNEVRTTQKFEQIANENEATQRTLRDTTAKTESATVKIRDLEEAKATSDRATAKRFSSLRSSINGSHFPNYNFEGELEGWTSHEGNTLTFKRIEDPSAPVPDVVEITGNMPMWIYSNEPTKIEIHKTYTLTAIVKSPTGLKSAKLVMMCYDKNKNLIRNIQTEPNHPLIEEQRNKGSQWVKLSGKVTEHSTTYPTTDRDKIPLHAVYATPALILESAIGGHFWVTQLDMQDTSQEENNLALINETKETLNTDRQSTALKFSEMETKFRDTESNIQGVAGQVEQVKSDVKKIDGRVVAEAEKAEQLTARVGRNEGAVQSLTRVINDEKSSTATKLEEMKSSFRRDLSNVIQNPDFLETRVTTTLNEQGQAIVTGSEEVPSHKNWNVAPPNKVRVITYDQNPITEHKTKFPSKYYLKTWANSVSPLNALSVSPNDKIYVSLGVYAQAATIPTEVYIRYSDKDNNLVNQHKLGSVSSRQTVKLSDTLTVPENATKAELVIFTGRDNLAESTGYTLISKPELRMNMAAIYADAKIEEAKLTISNENEALAQKVERLTADHNETKASVQREVNARAEKDNAITSEIETMKTSLEGANAEIVSIKATQVTDKQASAKALEQLSTDFNKKIGDLDVKSSSAIKSASDTFNDATKALTQKVDTQKSEFDGAIQKVNRETNSVKEIANKATSDISEIKTTINELDRSVVAKTEQLESNFNSTITEKALELNNKLANIKVGGRNLLWFSEVNSEKRNYWHGTKHANSSTVLTNADGNLIVNFNDTANLWTQWQQYGYTNGNWVVNTDLEKLEGDQEYTVSFKALNETGKNISTKVVIARDVTSGSRLDGFVKEIIIPPSTNSEWFNASVTGTLSSNIPNNFKGNRFLIVFQNANSGTLKLKNLQLEKGNIRTDWEMSQHDLDTLIEDSVSPVRTIAVEAKSSVNTLQQAINDAKGAHATLAYSLDARYRATKEETKREAVSEAQTLANTAQQNAIDQAQQLANTAQQNAINTASTDATNKANQAVQQAINWQIITARTDLNTLTNQGKFFIRFTSNPNAPITNHIYVSVDKAADNRITQSVQADNNPTLKYTRYWNGSTWTDWNKEPTTAEVQEVKTKVDNLKIGGRNYLSATKNLLSWKTGVRIWSSNKYSSEPTQRIEPIKGDDGVTYLTLKTALENNGSTFQEFWQKSREGVNFASDARSPSMAKMQVGKEYTLSFELKKVSGANPTRFRAVLRDYGTGGSLGDLFAHSINLNDIGEEWTKFHVTFTLNYKQTRLTHDHWSLHLQILSGVGEVLVRKPMLEEGNLAGDWVEALEDVEQTLHEFSVDFNDYKNASANDRQAIGAKIEEIVAGLDRSNNLISDTEYIEGLEEQATKFANTVSGYVRGIVGDGTWSDIDSRKSDSINVAYCGFKNKTPASTHTYLTHAFTPIIPGIYQCSVYVKNESTSSVLVYTDIQDQNKTNISFPANVNTYKDLTGSRTIPSGTVETTPFDLLGFTRVVFNIDTTNYPNARFARLIVRLNSLSTTSNSTNLFFACKPQITKIKKLDDTTQYAYQPGQTRTSIYGKTKEIAESIVSESGVLSQRIRGLESNFSDEKGKVSKAIQDAKDYALAEAGKASAGAIESYKVQVDADKVADSGNLLSKSLFFDFFAQRHGSTRSGAARIERTTEIPISGIGILEDNTTNWKELVQFSNEGTVFRQNGVERSSALNSIRNGLEYILEFEARGNAELKTFIREYYYNTANTRTSVGSNTNITNVTDTANWTKFKVKFTTNEITSNFRNQDPHDCWGVYFQSTSSTGKIEIRNPKLYQDMAKFTAEIKTVKQLALDAQGNLNAKIGVKVEASTGRVIGWEGGTNPNGTSYFDIKAENFKISNSNGTHTPFEIKNDGSIHFVGKVSFASVVDKPEIPKAITVVGTSNGVNSAERNPFLQIDSRKVITTKATGLRVIVLNKQTLDTISDQNYNISTDSGCNDFKTRIDSLVSSLGENILAIYSFGLGRKNANLITALNTLSNGLGNSYDSALLDSTNVAFAYLYQKIGTTKVESSSINSIGSNVAVFGIVHNGVLSAPNATQSPTINAIERIAQEKADTKNQLITDAKNKAEQGIRDAATAQSRAVSAETNAKSYADNKKTEAIATAANDATNKADAAKSSAISEAAKDATTKAGNAKSEAIAAAQTYTNTVRDNLELVKLISAQGAYNNNNAWIKVNNVNVSYTASEGIVLIVLNLTNLSEYHKNVYPNTTAGITSLHSYLSSTTLNGKLACIVSRCNVAVATANSTTFRDAFRRAGSTDLIYKTLKEKTNHTFALIGKIGSNGSAVESVVEVGASNIYGDLASVTTNWLKGDIVPTDVTMIDGGRIVTNTITAAHLQADSIDANKIKANAINAEKIQAKSIDISRLSVSVINVGKNLIKNPILANLGGSLKGWYIQNFETLSYFESGHRETVSWSPTGSIMFLGERSINFNKASLETGKPCQVFTDCEVKPNTTYLLSYWYQNHGQAHKLRLDSSDRGMGQYNRNNETTLTLIKNPGSFDRNLSESKRVVYKVVTGPNTRFLRPIWYFDTVGQRAHFSFARPMLEEVHPDHTIPSSFTNSGVIIDETGITAPNLSSISANIGHVTAGTVEGVYLKGSNLQVGNAHNVDGNGNITQFWTGGRGTHIATDGTIRTTAIEIRANSDTNPGHEVINVNDRFKVFRDGTLKIGAKAHGVVIDANGMRVYDGGNLKVRIGNLANDISGD